MSAFSSATYLLLGQMLLEIGMGRSCIGSMYVDCMQDCYLLHRYVYPLSDESSHALVVFPLITPPSLLPCSVGPSSLAGAS